MLLSEGVSLAQQRNVTKETLLHPVFTTWATYFLNAYEKECHS